MPIAFDLTNRMGPGGVSDPPFDRFNLATHVGDEPNAVTANRVALRDVHGVAGLVWMDQVHGGTVRIIRAADCTFSDVTRDMVFADCDAVVTADPEIALAVLVADCVPILLADDAAGVIGVAHAGRRGVALGILDNTIDAMAALGAEPGRLAVTFGPAIGGCCYQVSAAIHDEVVAAVPETAAHTRSGALSLDLRAGLVAGARRRGVRHVAVSAVCTAESPEHFSYRRDGRTGRFAGVIWRTL